MKILVVSLLRVGDLLMSAPALRDLRHRHPGAKIHVLVNSQSLRAMPLIPSIDKVFSFEREDIQKSLGEVDRPFFEAFDRTSALIDQLNAEGYDLAINLTHTRLSGYLMSLIDAKTKNGLTIDAQMKPSFGSHWFKFLNEQVDLESSEAFHFNDVFRYGMDLGEISSRGPSLLVTEAGRAEAKAIFADAGVVGPVISIQALTSDEKKDWPLASYETSIQGIASRHPEVSFAILAAPFEVERLNPFVERLVKAGLKAFLAKSSLEGAAGILEKSSLLLTGDTSIKHLASGIGTPIVEIVLGGSDASRTGAYRHGSIVVRSREACAPCVHSRPCHRERRFCAERVPSVAVTMISSEVYSGRIFQVPYIAREFKNEIEVLKVDSHTLNRFELVSFNPEFAEAAIARSVDRLCRVLWLSGMRRPMDGIGTEARKQWSLFKKQYSSISDYEWKHLFSAFEMQVIGVEGRVNSLKTGFKSLQANFENPRSYAEFVRSLRHFREKIRPSPLLGLMLPLLDSVVEDDISPPFVKLRRLSDVMTEIEARAILYRRVIRALDQSVESMLEMENL